MNVWGPRDKPLTHPRKKTMEGGLSKPWWITRRVFCTCVGGFLYYLLVRISECISSGGVGGGSEMWGPCQLHKYSKGYKSKTYIKISIKITAVTKTNNITNISGSRFTSRYCNIMYYSDWWLIFDVVINVLIAGLNIFGYSWGYFEIISHK